MLNSFQKAPRLKRAQSHSVAAPLNGWNARDPLGAMHALDAPLMINFWPATSEVDLRYGKTHFATDISGQIESLLSYSGGTSNQFFAAAITSIYDVTAGGAIGAADLTGLTNARWQYTNITTTGGSYIMCVNGADKLRTYDGTNWHMDGDGAPYDITGVDTATCIHIELFKNRIWLIKTGTLKAWYLPINAIGGAAVGLDMSSIARLGGYLMAAGTWTLDAGYGNDDYLVFITSNGEAIAWRLTDPTSPTGIALIGVYNIGSPIGRRCVIKYGGDLLIITVNGIISMANEVLSTQAEPQPTISDKIKLAVSRATTAYGSNYGWQIMYFPKENQLYLNVPVQEGLSQQQYVMNDITKKWAQFTGWAANCFDLFNNNLYFGGNGFVAKAWDGFDDNGVNIDAFCIQSFQYYGSAKEKRCTMIRPHLFTNGAPTIYGNVNTNFDLSDTAAELSFAATVYGLWDVSLWDTGLWGSDLVPIADWQNATGIGYCFAPILKVSSQDIKVQWISSDMIFEEGGEL